MSNLKTLEAHNDERRILSIRSDGPVANGIACPKCGDEMQDSNPNVTLTSDPPMKNVRCPSCGHTTYRLA